MQEEVEVEAEVIYLAHNQLIHSNKIRNYQFTECIPHSGVSCA